MDLPVTLPVAFSVRDVHEFQAHRHLLQRMNPALRVTEVATGVHVHGGATVYWGLVHDADTLKVPEDTILAALVVAGFDVTKGRLKFEP